MIKRIIIAICSITIGATIAIITATPKQTYDCEHVIIENAIPMPNATFICKTAPGLSQKEKEELYQIATEIIVRYKEDEEYNEGCTNQITPYLIMGLINTESKGNQYCKGKAGEIGLTQIIPKYHEKSLKSAGIIKQSNDLWNKKENIEAGIYILMHNAKNSETIEEALSKYNSGRITKQGIKYANKVIAASKGEN